MYFNSLLLYVFKAIVHCKPTNQLWKKNQMTLVNALFTMAV